jgi:flagellar motor switch protein FliN/FliY
MSHSLESLVQSVAAELAVVAGSLLGVEAHPEPTSDPLDVAWAVPCQLTAPAPGTLVLGFHRPDALALATRLLMAEQASDSDVADALSEVVGQTISAVVTKQTVPGLAARAGKPEPGIPDGPALSAFACRIDEAFAIRVACWFEDAPVRAAAPATMPVPAARGEDRAPRPGGPDNLDILLDIDMPLSVRFGEAVMTLDALTRMGPGSLIELSRQPDDPVDVLINGRLVARGEVVVVSGNYGVRVTEVVSAAERLNTMNA